MTHQFTTPELVAIAVVFAFLVALAYRLTIDRQFKRQEKAIADVEAMLAELDRDKD